MKRKLLIHILLLFSLFSLIAQEGVLSIKVFPLTWSAQIVTDQNYIPLEEYQRRGNVRDYRLAAGEYTVLLSAPAHRPQMIRVSVEGGSEPGAIFDPSWDGYGRETGPLVVESKLETYGTPLRWLGEAPTGGQPKSVEFFGGTDHVVVPLLMGPGLDIYSVENGLSLGRVIIPEPFGSQEGFVESAYLFHRNEIWVSQMESGMVHIIDASTLIYLDSVSAGGFWTKIITPSPDEKFLYTSNWKNRNVGIIDTESRELVGTVPISGIPRGMTFGSNPEILYVCVFETGNIEKIDVVNHISLGIIKTGPGAARHIVYDEVHKRFFVSDMMTGRVYSFSETTERVTARSAIIGGNPNTIKLTSNGRYIFASNRGWNNPDTFLKKGPDYGHITVLDGNTLEIIHQIWGMNQPTGLALSEDDNTLVFTDFKDDKIEFYDVSGIYDVSY